MCNNTNGQQKLLSGNNQDISANSLDESKTNSS